MIQTQQHITWGIIGCGDVAEVKSSPPFTRCDHSELVAVPAYMTEDNCTIYGSKGTIEFPFYRSQLKYTVGSETTVSNFKNPVHIQQPFMQENVNYFLDQRSNPCSVDEGAIVTVIIDKFTHNINT